MGFVDKQGHVHMYAGGQENRTPPQTNGSGSFQRSQPTFLKALYQKATPKSFRHMPLGCISVIRAALRREYKSVMRIDYRGGDAIFFVPAGRPPQRGAI